MGYNKVILNGNLTRDVEVRYTQSGSAVGSTGIAVNRRYTAANGEKKEEVMFVDLTFFGRTAEIANQYLHKGSQILVDGRLDFQQWTTQDGSKRSKHAVIVENMQMLGSANQAPQGGQAPAQGQPAPQPQAQPAHQPAPQPQAQPVPHIDVQEDEIPF